MKPLICGPGPWVKSKTCQEWSDGPLDTSTCQVVVTVQYYYNVFYFYDNLDLLQNCTGEGSYLLRFDKIISSK